MCLKILTTTTTTNNKIACMMMSILSCLWIVLVFPWEPATAFSSLTIRRPLPTTTSLFSATTTTRTMNERMIGKPIPIDKEFPGLVPVHRNPDIYLIQDFLTDEECSDIITKALEKGTMKQSPVAYGGWTDDFKDLLELFAKGPVAWIALIGAWYQVTSSTTSTTSNQQVDLVVHALQNYFLTFLVTALGVAFFTYARANSLQELRTSTSTTLDQLTPLSSTSPPVDGVTQFVTKTAQLLTPPSTSSPLALRNEAELFEAPTVIRYEANQKLAPHYDANRSANKEDLNRGGQTLATLLVYLNTVPKGGTTRFGKLYPPTTAAAATDKERAALEQAIDRTETETGAPPKLAIQPKIGDALLFFPADSNGNFDDRLEHEGCPAIDEKWIARIWRHQYRVPPPFGLGEESLSQLQP